MIWHGIWPSTIHIDGQQRASRLKKIGWVATNVTMASYRSPNPFIGFSHVCFAGRKRTFLLKRWNWFHICDTEKLTADIREMCPISLEIFDVPQVKVNVKKPAQLMHIFILSDGIKCFCQQIGSKDRFWLSNFSSVASISSRQCLRLGTRN